jgi:hypothetical protein
MRAAGHRRQPAPAVLGDPAPGIHLPGPVVAEAKTAGQVRSV